MAPVRRMVLAACLAGMVTIGDGFVYLLLQRSEQLSIGWFPLLAVGTNLSCLLLAAPPGPCSHWSECWCSRQSRSGTPYSQQRVSPARRSRRPIR